MAKPLSERSLRMRSFLKDRLRRMNITYSALAGDIGVSLPTVKRWLTREDLPVEALEAILSRLDLSWAEFLGALEVPSDQRAPSTEKQEHFIARHPRETFVFLLLFVGHSARQIRRKLGLTERELEAILFRLDKANLIAYRNEDSIRPLVKLPLRWTEKGEFSQSYFPPVVRQVFEGIVKPKKGFSSTFHPSQPLVTVGETYLSDRSLTRLKTDLWELLEKYREVARHEGSALRLEERNPVTFLFAVDQFPLWKKVLWDRE